ncbi:hypothetical protein [Confluentibacter flavum]|uniref:HEAT repeat domain-containing protein n=1 Tax=Confluentibacter flavum TaxID=1909700 RepID=A0A2N3HFQ2_9FLAO|nr:hypothetical protein [Confluentibacter flavum]PKQ43806.1 hypothetical protein CSW08_17615 [Confluentibacter flavum]
MVDYQYIYDYYNNAPHLIKWVWWVSALLAISIIVLAVYLKFIRLSLRKKSNEKAKFKSEYEALLVEYLYSGDESGKLTNSQKLIVDRIKDSIKTPSRRKLIVSVLYNLMNEVSGEMSDSIKTFYYETGLIHYAFERLKSKKWNVIAKGISELRRFGIDEASHAIAPFINHPKSDVRSETHLYMVNLFLFDGLSFLDNLKVPLSEWIQIQLLETLQKFDNQEICDIRPWLMSENNSVVLFALKLAQIYNQFEVKETLMDLLSHENKEIRIESIDVLTHLYGIEAKEMLKANFITLSLGEQISFFKLLEKLVVPDDEPFVEAYLFHKNFEIQLLALQIIKEINFDKYIGFTKSSNNNKSLAMVKAVKVI